MGTILYNPSGGVSLGHRGENVYDLNENRLNFNTTFSPQTRQTGKTEEDKSNKRIEYITKKIISDKY